MKVFASLAVALVAAIALSPAAAMDNKAIAPRRRPEPLTAVEGLANTVRRLEEVLAEDNEAVPEETGAEGDNDEVLAAETTEAPTDEATEAPTADSDADAETAPTKEEFAPLIEPVSYKADSYDASGSTDADAAADADVEEAGNESAVEEETSAPEGERRRNLRSL